MTAYRGERRNAVGQEIIVELGEIGPAARLKLQRRVNVQAQRIRAFDDTQDVLRFLLDDVLLLGEMVEDGVSAFHFGGRGNVD